MLKRLAISLIATPACRILKMRKSLSAKNSLDNELLFAIY